MRLVRIDTRQERLRERANGVVLVKSARKKKGMEILAPSSLFLSGAQNQKSMRELNYESR